jgi:hypothetical protein
MSEQLAAKTTRSTVWFWALIMLGVAAAVAALGTFVGWWDWSAVLWGVGSWLVFVGAIVLYFVPTIIAVKRKHRSTGGIVALNILAGWTFLGWLIALVWSLSSAQPPVVVQQFAVPAPVQYQVGDVVNAHRWNGQTLEPVQ